MFFTRPSVSQSVSQSVCPSVLFFLCNSSETAQQNFATLCRYEGHYVLMCIRVTPFFNLEIWPKWKILLKQFVSAIPLKPLNRISWNFAVMKDIMCRCAYPQEILIPLFSRSYALFELWPKWKIILFFLLAQLLWNRSTEIRETL